MLAQLGDRLARVLEIAKQARASDQMLYGSTPGLIRDIITRNGSALHDLPVETLANRDDPLQAPELLGPVPLRLVTDVRAITMTRAAVTDATETGTLAQAIDELARGAILPLIVSLMQALEAWGRFLAECGAQDAAETPVALRCGATQFRPALGTLGPPDEAEIPRRSDRAFALSRRLGETGKCSKSWGGPGVLTRSRTAPAAEIVGRSNLHQPAFVRRCYVRGCGGASRTSPMRCDDVLCRHLPSGGCRRSRTDPGIGAGRGHGRAQTGAAVARGGPVLGYHPPRRWPPRRRRCG